jgi:hypothetical protein
LTDHPNLKIPGHRPTRPTTYPSRPPRADRISPVNWRAFPMRVATGPPAAVRVPCADNAGVDTTSHGSRRAMENSGRWSDNSTL